MTLGVKPNSDLCTSTKKCCHTRNQLYLRTYSQDGYFLLQLSRNGTVYSHMPRTTHLQYPHKECNEFSHDSHRSSENGRIGVEIQI